MHEYLVIHGYLLSPEKYTIDRSKNSRIFAVFKNGRDPKTIEKW